MTVEAFIPARFGSTRLNGKALADICGKTMIQRVYERAKKARLVSSVTVATDDERILKAVESFGGRAVLTSRAHTSGTDRIAEATKGSSADIIVNVQGDEPLIDPGVIDAAIEPVISDPSILLSTVKTRIKEEEDYLYPNVVKVVTDKDGYALYFSRSPIPHQRAGFGLTGIETFKHIGLYVYKREFLQTFARLKPTALELSESLEQLRALENGYRIKVVETAYDPVSVDTPEDLERVRAIVGASRE